MGIVSNRLLGLLGPRLEPCGLIAAPTRPAVVEHALRAVCAAHDAVDITDWRAPLADLAALLRDHGDQPEALLVARELVGKGER